ncbi:hypothetical protein LR48_Vigan01g013000 [Vigna angularis]|uniref:Uncharacterized protein n=2 Tax=Phaseolus angularis TaxID=3914 RepID=A0A0L9TJD1_PHAAN|nr:cation/H(+) antiporter 15 [Vigna angularis]KOM30576.1 hypothetical protein LR48_Vigan01g013000 [Vigna angularis]
MKGKLATKSLAFDVNETEPIICYAATMVSSEGLWHKENPLNYSLPLFLLQLLLVLVVTRLFVYILKPIRQPRVISELMGGIILGPSVLGKNKTFSNAVFPQRGEILLEAMANVGIVYFMFLVGVGMDAQSLRRIGRKAVTIAVLGMVLPFAIGALFAVYLIKFDGISERSTANVLFIGSILSVAAFPVLVRILAELKFINSELGRIALSSALVNDLLSCLLLIFSINLAQRNKPSITMLSTFLSSVGFIAFNIFVVRPGVLWMVRKTPEGETFNDFYMCVILAGVMLSGLITDAIGTHAVFGAFVFGLTIPNGPLGLSIVERLEDFITLLLLPLFFATNGLKTNLGLLDDFREWVILITLVILTSIGKIIGTMVAAFYYQISVRDGAVLGLLLNTKGVVEIIVINIGKDKKVLSSESFATLMLISILMTAIIVPGMSLIYKPMRGMIPYKRRTIQMSQKESEFRVLVCIHTPRNVPTMINLLDATNPSKRSPICIYLLHLTELSGQASALFLVQHHTAKDPDQPAYNKTEAQSEHIVNAFRNYEHHAFHVSVQPSTVISPYSTMHEDVCNLAQDKRVAFVIVPFHKHQAVDGEMEPTNMSHRTVNLNILSQAPCSVGILVDRGFSTCSHLAPDQKSRNVAVLFFGGPDDREALSYAWKMSENPGINLTVMRFVHGEEVMHQHSDLSPDESTVLTVKTDKDSQKKLDERLISWFRTSCEDDGSVVYVEKMVNNGEQTVAAIRSMDDIHDLFIIGRSEGMKSPLIAGLTDWSECPELGAIGDLLASSDFAATASVLIVQQYLGQGTEDVLETNQEEEQTLPP